METSKSGSRIGLYIDGDLLTRCDAAIPLTNARSRSEFICDAIEYYIAVLTAKGSSKVITPALESVIGGKIAGTEDRISRMIFKLAAKAMGITPKVSTKTKRSEILLLSAVAMMFPFMKITPADDRQRLR